MVQKHNRNILNGYTVCALVLIVVAVASAAVVLRHTHTDAAPSVRSGIGAAVPSQFSFAGTIGWWQGATNKTSMALFHNSDGCFTSVEHKTGTVNVAAELQKAQDSLMSDGYTVTAGTTQMVGIQTTAGPKQYELHQSAVTTPAGATKVEGGQEFGYLQLSNGYLKIMGYCDTANQLSATIPALQAITFNETK